MPVWLLSFGLKAFGFVRQTFQALLGLVTRYPLQCALALAIVVCGWLWHVNGVQKDAIKILGGKVSAERKAHQETIANYRAAAKVAEKAMRDNAARVARERAAIDERKINALKDDRDRTAAGAERLRVKLDTLKRQTGNLDLSAIMEATCRTFEETGCDGLSAKLVAAQANTDQLLRLIEDAEEQGAVETSPDTGGQ